MVDEYSGNGILPSFAKNISFYLLLYTGMYFYSVVSSIFSIPNGILPGFTKHTSFY